MSEAVIRRIGETIGANTRIWYPDDKGVLEPYGAFGNAKTATISRRKWSPKWCFEQRQAAGLGTDTMPSAARYYIPIRGTNLTVGVVGIRPEGRPVPARPDAGHARNLRRPVGSALERSETAESAEKAKLLAEKERMRNILLSSVSHDLRSPLAAITGAADTLLQSAPDGNGGRANLLWSIRHEAARLTRIVSNLLDITRIEGGQLKLNMHPYDPAEIIGSGGSRRPAARR